MIEQNWIYDNPDRGIQFYPNSQGAVVRGNVIDGNGEGIIFSGDYGFASAGNVVKGNLITNSRLRHDVESWYPDGNPIGTRNVVRDNCIGGGAFGGVESPQRGFQAQANALGDPGYAGRGAGDYRVGRRERVCRGSGPGALTRLSGHAGEVAVVRRPSVTLPMTTSPKACLPLREMRSVMRMVGGPRRLADPGHDDGGVHAVEQGESVADLAERRGVDDHQVGQAGRLGDQPGHLTPEHRALAGVDRGGQREAEVRVVGRGGEPLGQRRTDGEVARPTLADREQVEPPRRGPAPQLRALPQVERQDDHALAGLAGRAGTGRGRSWSCRHRWRRW